MSSFADNSETKAAASESGAAASVSASAGKKSKGLSEAQQRLDALRSLMEMHELDAYVVPSEDAHSSEYIAENDERRAWVSGFDGSAGLVVVTAGDKPTARLWTDGRYFLQANEQLDASAGWVLMKDRIKTTPSPPAWLVEELKGASKPPVVGVDPELFSCKRFDQWSKQLAAADYKPAPILSALCPNLVDQIWKKGAADDDVSAFAESVVTHSTSFAGKSREEKVAALRAEVDGKANAVAAVVAALDEVAWLLNLRGADIPYNPVFKSYVAVMGTANGGGTALFVDERKLSDGAKAALTEANVEIRAYGVDEVAAYVSEKTKISSHGRGAGGSTSNVLLDMTNANAALRMALRNRGLGVPSGSSLPITLQKALKNDAELASMRSCHLRDAVALLEYFYWLERVVFAAGAGELGSVDGGLNEVQAANKLETLRKEQHGFRGLSFPTISSSGPNGAVIHYHPREGQQQTRKLKRSELYLCDSGAHYEDGTTDVTRTLHFGEGKDGPSAHQRRCFTRVLQGHIALATAVFPEGTEGHKLDPMARAPLWSDGLDYRHGTGHGVGAFLNVHEGPQGVGQAPRRDYKGGLRAGMTVTDEPGYYEDGSFGIRIESCLVVKEEKTRHNFGGGTYLGFENLTFVPIQRKLIDIELLSEKERTWLDEYHAAVRAKLAPLLEAQGKPAALKKYLEEETLPLSLPHTRE